MRAPTPLRGGLAARFSILAVGLVFCSIGIVSMLESRLGLSPWDVLHQGVAKTTPLSFGAANIVVGVVILAGSWLLGARVGIGTIANTILIGVFVQVLLDRSWVEHLSEAPVGVRVALLLGGLAAIGVGSGLYLGANLGAGPRDSLMVVGAARSGVRIGVVRIAIELVALASGWALGGSVGLGTLVFAAGIGPAVELSFAVLARTPLALAPARGGVAVPPAAALERA